MARERQGSRNWDEPGREGAGSRPIQHRTTIPGAGPAQPWGSSLMTSRGCNDNCPDGRTSPNKVVPSQPFHGARRTKASCDKALHPWSPKEPKPAIFSEGCPNLGKTRTSPVKRCLPSQSQGRKGQGQP
ncbi:unnamed protein product [Merluccius merluccius]